MTSRTWETYKKRLLTLVLVMLGMYVLTFGSGIFVGFAAGMLSAFLGSGAVMAGLIIGVVAVFIASLLGQAAVVYAASDESLDVKDAYASSWRRIGSFIWMWFLMVYIATGFSLPLGAVLMALGGKLILVAMPVLLLLFLSLMMFMYIVPFVFAREEEKGMDAILKGFDYARGAWFPAVLRFFGVIVLYFLVAMVLIMPVTLAMINIFPLRLGQTDLVLQLYQSAVNLLIMPFFMIFGYKLYEDLRNRKGGEAFHPGTGQKVAWLVAATVGLLAAPAILVLTKGMAFLKMLMSLRPGETVPL